MKTEFKAETFGVPWFDINLPFPCEIHWLRPRYEVEQFRRNNYPKVLLINTEPSEWCIPENELFKVGKFFDLIIAKDYLPGFTNVTVLSYGNSIVDSTKQKEFGISNLVSMGNHGGLLSGHIFRIASALRLADLDSNFYDVYKGRYFDAHINKINQSLWPFFSSMAIYPHDSKSELFKKTFNICIENSAERNYFTEKLIDCFRTFTVPLYWGCPNIADHFDARGIIFINDLECVRETIINLSAEDYYARMPYLIENYERSKYYWDSNKNIRDVILNKFQKQTLDH